MPTIIACSLTAFFLLNTTWLPAEDAKKKPQLPQAWLVRHGRRRRER